MQRRLALGLAIWSTLYASVGIADSGPSGTPAESARGLVARSIGFHGGKVYKSSRTSLRLCSKSGCSALEVERDGGLYEYCATAEVEAGRRRVCIANDRVEELLDGVAPVGGAPPGTPAHEARERALRDWVMERVYFVFLPSRLDDPSVRMEDLGSESWDGRVLRKIKVTFEPGTSTDADDEFLFWFDPETARLEQFAYSYERNDGGVRFRELTNYRRIGGILFFDQENFGVDGPGLSVDLVSPEFAREGMRHVSTVELRDIGVAPLE